MHLSYALIADIVSSRKLPNRLVAQSGFEQVLEQAAEGLDLLQPPYATVGDEFQAVAPSLEAALTLTLRTHLLLDEGLDLRFGIGAGQVLPVGEGAAPKIQDGSGWWAARAAIDAAHAAQDSGLDFVRTRYHLADEHKDAQGGGGPLLPAEGYVNALLTLRDQAVDRLAHRPRRVLGHLLLGATQAEAARREGVSQPAVSDLVRGTGAGLLAAQSLLAAPFGKDRGGAQGRRG